MNKNHIVVICIGMFAMSTYIQAMSLQEAAAEGRLSEIQAAVRSLLDAGDINNQSSLFYAARNGHEDVVSYLLEAGATPCMHALAVACKSGHKKLIPLFINANAELDYPFVNHYTILHHVCDAGDEPTAQVLIDAGANIDAISLDGKTPLYCAYRKRHDGLVRFLLSKRAKLNAGAEDKNPLLAACKEGQEEVVQIFIDAGVSVSAHKPLAVTPLHKACEREQEGVVRLLLGARASVDEQDEAYGLRPLQIASARENTNIIRALLAAGALVNAQDWDGQTALYKALICGRHEAAELLLAAGARLDIITKAGKRMPKPSEKLKKRIRTRHVRRIINGKEGIGMKSIDGTDRALPDEMIELITDFERKLSFVQ